ncbi:transposase [Mesorhizobium sp. M0410]|uniref:transposase n=1 Tax=Mesorhizobium sp. M0410 TaxID=2956943 RepID=UPI00333B46D4
MTHSLALVDDPARLCRSRKVGAHFGLTPPRRYSSGEIDLSGRISKMGDRHMLYLAAQITFDETEDLVVDEGKGNEDCEEPRPREGARRPFTPRCSHPAQDVADGRAVPVAENGACQRLVEDVEQPYPLRRKSRQGTGEGESDCPFGVQSADEGTP